MNGELSGNIRAQYKEAYHYYDAQANAKFYRAVHEFDEKVAEGESPDVLPLYITTFLHYAAGVSWTIVAVRHGTY